VVAVDAGAGPDQVVGWVGEGQIEIECGEGSIAGGAEEAAIVAQDVQVAGGAGLGVGD
jgi:hypothetical protein